MDEGPRDPYRIRGQGTLPHQELQHGLPTGLLQVAMVSHGTDHLHHGSPHLRPQQVTMVGIAIEVTTIAASDQQPIPTVPTPKRHYRWRRPPSLPSATSRRCWDRVRSSRDEGLDLGTPYFGKPPLLTLLLLS